MSHVAGSGRGSFDNRFALPSRTAGPFSSFFYPVDIFPFSDVEQLDPETGRRDGLLVMGLAVLAALMVGLYFVDYTNAPGTAGGLVYGGTSRCRMGTKTCAGACSGFVGPVPELCNGVDDDCDGSVDEGATDGVHGHGPGSGAAPGSSHSASRGRTSPASGRVSRVSRA